MAKVEWEPKIVDKIYINKKLRFGSLYGRIGCINLHCRFSHMSTGKRRWYSYVSIRGLSNLCFVGSRRLSLNKAKEDCIRLAREMMLDYREGLRVELKNFDLEIGE